MLVARHHVASVTPTTRASGEMADALASGASVRKDVGVQVPPRAPNLSTGTHVGKSTERLSFHLSIQNHSHKNFTVKLFRIMHSKFVRYNDNHVVQEKITFIQIWQSATN